MGATYSSVNLINDKPQAALSVIGNYSAISVITNEPPQQTCKALCHMAFAKTGLSTAEAYYTPGSTYGETRTHLEQCQRMCGDVKELAVQCEGELGVQSPQDDEAD
jgi:hypothetical protein